MVWERSGMGWFSIRKDRHALGGCYLELSVFQYLVFTWLSNALSVLLKHLLKDHGLCVHIFLQLKEQLCQADQTHRSELEGMKKEISRLTQELHQRDITIASANGSTSDLEQQLRTEIERAERKAVEHRVKNSSAVSLMEQRAWNTALHFLAMLSFFLSATFKQRLWDSSGEIFWFLVNLSSFFSNL